VDLCLWVDHRLKDDYPDYSQIIAKLDRAKYDIAGKRLFGEKYIPRELDGPLMLGNGAQLLATLTPDRLNLDDLGPIKGLSNARNKCEFEHGLLPKPPSHADVEKYLEKTCDIIARLFGGRTELENWLVDFQFPFLIPVS
jgi:hypothetical protein